MPVYTGCRSSITNSPIAGLSSENVGNGVMGGDTTPSTSELGSSLKVPPILTMYNTLRLIAPLM